MKLDEKGFPQPTGEFETLEADSLILALGQDVDLSLLDGVSGLAIKDGVVQVGPNMMTGHPGVFAGGDMVPSRAHRDGRRRPRQEGRAPHRRLAARRLLRAGAEARARELRQAQQPGTTRDAPKTVRPMLEMARRSSTFEEVRARSRRDQRAVRGASLPVVRQLLRMRQLLRRMPGQCRDQARTGQALRVQLRLSARAAACAPQECPCGAIQMVQEAI